MSIPEQIAAIRVNLAEKRAARLKRDMRPSELAFWQSIKDLHIVSISPEREIKHIGLLFNFKD